MTREARGLPGHNRHRALWQRTSAGAFAVLGLLAIINFATHSAPIITDSDFAVSELYVELATRGQLLVGPYSRFGWHHPGPLFFYIVAPFYALGGHQAAALYAVALAVNLAALVAMAWVMASETRGPLVVTVIGACVLFAWRAPRFLASPWNAHVAVLPCLAFLVAAAAVAAGRLRLLPLTVAFGSFAAQTHVGFVPVVFVITAAVAGHRMVSRRADGSNPWPSLKAAACVLAALWMVPFAEALRGDGGNVAALWRFFVADARADHSIREAIATGSYGLAGVLRPDFDLPWGGHFELSHLQWTIPGAIAIGALLTLVARRDVAAGRRFEGALALVAIAATATSFWGLTRVRGDILTHDLFRLAAIGSLNLGILGAAGMRTLSGLVGLRLPRPAAGLVSHAIVLTAAVIVGVRDLDSLTSYERRQNRSAIVDAYAAVRAYVAAEGVRRPLIGIDNDRWGDAAGVLVRLLQDGTPAAVMDANLSMFSKYFTATGDEDALITLANLELHRRLRIEPNTVILLQAFPLFVDAVKIVPARPGGA